MSDVKINLLVDPKLISVDDMCSLEDKTKPITSMRGIMARFVVGPDDKYLPYEQAYKMIGKLNSEEFTEVAEKFANGMKDKSLPTIGDGQ